MASIVVYDPLDGTVANRVTNYIPSAHTPTYLGNPNTVINPDLSVLINVPDKYWKYQSGSTIIEMSAGEKTSIDGLLDDPVSKIDTDWKNNYTDWKQARAAMIILVNATLGGFDNLTGSQKEIAARWFAVTPAEQFQVYPNIDELIALGEIFHAESVAARRIRLHKAMLQVYARLDYETEVNVIVADMLAGNLFYMYTEIGQEGTVEGDNEAIFDYVDGRAGTQWASPNGLRHKTFTPVGMSNSGQLADKVLDIMQNGNY